MQWLIIICLSAFSGALCAVVFTGKRSMVCAAAFPWLGLLAWLLYGAYFAPSTEGGASMWLVAQLFAGSIAAAIGVLTCVVIQRHTANVV